MRYCGIDPGVQGGIAFLEEDGRVVAVVRMPADVRGILQAIELYRGDGIRCALEFVRARPGMGRASMFAFGRGYGRLEAALVAMKVDYVEVLPRKWQAGMGCLSRGDKNVTKQRAARLFPGVKITHANADALLIAEYQRRISLGWVPASWIGRQHSKRR